MCVCVCVCALAWRNEKGLFLFFALHSIARVWCTRATFDCCSQTEKLLRTERQQRVKAERELADLKVVFHPTFADNTAVLLACLLVCLLVFCFVFSVCLSVCLLVCSFACLFVCLFVWKLPHHANFQGSGPPRPFRPPHPFRTPVKAWLFPENIPRQHQQAASGTGGTEASQNKGLWLRAMPSFFSACWALL